MGNGPYPVFAYEKDKEGTVSGSVADDQSTFTIVGHSFLVGENFFISSSVDSGNQSLGAILDVDGNDVSTTWPTVGAKGGASKVWTAPAGQVAPFTYGATRGYDPSDDSRIHYFDTPGGTSVATRLGAEVEFFTLSFDPAITEDWAAWRTFRRTKRRGGLDTFSIGFVDWETGLPTMDKVRYIQRISGIKFRNSAGFGAFALLFRRIERDLYVTV